jgi:hypothetical protein
MTARVVGHDTVLRILSWGLPPVLLLSGPPGVGKHALAEQLMNEHGVLPVDRITHDQLSVAQARQLRAQVCVGPHGVLRIVLLSLDGCTPAALSALLTVLETPPSGTRFILLASQPVPDTIASRAMVWRCGLLRAGESAQVLCRLGMTRAAAQTAALRAHGRALPELAAESPDRAHEVARRLIHGIASGDRELVDAALRMLDRDSVRVFRAALVEIITGRWREFPAGELSLPASTAQRLLVTLSRISGARPALAVRVVLETVLPGISSVSLPAVASPAPRRVVS